MGELGYLDDRAFAESWVQSRMALRKEGWKALYRGLSGKGVARALAEEVVAAACPFEEELERRGSCSAGFPRSAAIRRPQRPGVSLPGDCRRVSKELREKRREGAEE